MRKNQPRQKSFHDLHASTAQHLANVTKVPTSLHNDAGLPRFVVAGWPCRGALVVTCSPQFGGAE